MSFPPDQLYCVMDYETFSEADLKKVGSFEYSTHPSTEILCGAFRIGTRKTLPKAKTQSFCRHPEQYVMTGAYSEFWRAMQDRRYIYIGHNSLFEQVITLNTLSPVALGKQPLPPQRWLCTAALASALALPRKLEGACAVLKLPTQKDMSGHRLMLKMSKPRRPSKHNPSTRHLDPDDLKALTDYCVTDVDAETELFLKCPPLTPFERKVWELDQEINLRGFNVDRNLVQTIQRMIAVETKRLLRRVAELTDGEIRSTKQRDKTLAWLEENGLFLSDLKAKTVEDALEEGLATGDAKRLLLVRQALSKTSNAKYDAFEQRSRFDGRLRDNLLYHGASTGRWSGAGLQIQNFPKGDIKDTSYALRVIARGDTETVRLLYGEPMDAFASCLRGMIVPTRGKVLCVGDYNAIEARVLFWVADHVDGLRAFREGRPLYEELAAKIFNKRVEDIEPESLERFLGKTATLGSGFQMGPPKFQDTCKQQGREVTTELAEAAIAAYRDTHRPVVKLWKTFERAFTAAVQNPGKRYTINHTSWWVSGGFLWCQLPSGRRLAYFGAAVENESTKWGRRPVLKHWGVNPKTKQWARESTYGGRLVENCFTSETQVLTSRGWVTLFDLRANDWLWDGCEYVRHAGLIDQGIQEVGWWEGVRVTAKHLILVGEKWKSVMDLGVDATRAAQKLGQDSAPWSSRKQGLGIEVSPNVPVTAALAMQWRRVRLYVGKTAARLAGMLSRATKECATWVSSRVKSYSTCGGIVSQASSRAATTRNVKRIRTTVGAESVLLPNGARIVKPSSSTPNSWQGGTTQRLTWTESITARATFQAISAWYRARLTHAIGAIAAYLLSAGKNSLLLKSTKASARSGQEGLSTSMQETDARATGLWRAIEKPERVYDIRNCGPRHRFMVLTSGGPVIVHNCVQAIARDLMASAMLRLKRHDYDIVLSVHDELAIERDLFGSQSLEEFLELMGRLPKWAKGLPVRVSGWESERYKK